MPQRDPVIKRRSSSTGLGFFTGRWRTGAGRGLGTGASEGSAAVNMRHDAAKDLGANYFDPAQAANGSLG